MAPFGVEIDQIDEDQPALRRSSRAPRGEGRHCRRCSCPCARRPVSRWAKMSPILPIETTARPARAARCSRLPSGGGIGEILAVGGADEILGARADERPGDHPADVQRIAESARDAAESHRAARGRTPPRARRSGAPSWRRCSRSASAFAGAPRHSPRSPRCPRRGDWRECRLARLRRSSLRVSHPGKAGIVCGK